MYTESADYEQIRQWVSRCLAVHDVRASQVVNVKQEPGREVWTCTVTCGAATLPVVVKIFKPSEPDAVNSTLPPVAAAKKCALAKQELCALGLPTPTCFGFASEDESAAIAVEWLTQTAWTSSTRVAAAQSLASLHRLDLRALSDILQALIQQSDPRPQRTYLWFTGNVQKLDEIHTAWRTNHPDLAAAVNGLLATRYPVASQRVLVHGDYFSANILATADGIRMIDWETFALGAPMWDLGFLIGADRDLAPSVVEEVIEAYGKIAPLAMGDLLWHKQCWDLCWQLHDLIKQLENEKNIYNTPVSRRGA